MKKKYQQTSFLSKVLARAVTNAVIPPKKGIPRTETGARIMLGRVFINWLSGKK